MMAARPDDLAEPGRLTVIVTPMRRRHLRGVMRIEQQVYPRPWSLGLYMSELAMGPSRVYLAARIGTTVVGYAGLMVIGEEGHVTTVAVDPAWQGHQVATRLLVHLVRQAAARGVHDLTLEVRVGNDAAQAIYRRFGFAPAGARKGYYADNGEDALVMWVHDIHLSEHAARVDEIEAWIGGHTVVEGLS